jgi:hypothetical protein
MPVDRTAVVARRLVPIELDEVHRVIVAGGRLCFGLLRRFCAHSNRIIQSENTPASIDRQDATA